MKIINALAVTLTQGEKANLLARSPKNLEAYLKYLQGLERFNRMNKEDNTMARKFFEEATVLGRNFAVAYVYVGWTHYYDLWFGSSSSPADSVKQAFEAAKTSIALEDSLPDAHCLLSFLYCMRRQHDDSIKEAEEAVTLNPNLALGYVSLGSAFFWSGKTEEAIVALERGVRLDPVPPSIYLAALGMAYRDAGRYEEAIAVSRKAIMKEPNNVIAHVVLISTYSMLNRMDEARTAAAEILRIDPTFSLDRFAKTRPHIDPGNTARFADSLRKAGLK
jgi:adenylate cyclase